MHHYSLRQAGISGIVGIPCPASPSDCCIVSGNASIFGLCPCRTEQPIESPKRHRPLQASVLSHWQCYSSTDCLEHLSTYSFWNGMTDNLPLAQIHGDFCCRLNGSEWGSATKKPPQTAPSAQACLRSTPSRWRCSGLAPVTSTLSGSFRVHSCS